MFEQILRGVTNQYLKGLIIFIISFIVIRITLSIIERIALRITSKTKTEIDDKLVRKVSFPLTSLTLLISIRIAIHNILVQENIKEIIINIDYSAILIVIAYIIYVVIDLVVVHLIRKTVMRTRTPIDNSLISLVHSVMYVTLVVSSFLYILHIWGVEIGPLLAGLGIAGLAVALALQPVLSNIFSGASLILDRSVRVGDVVILDSNMKGTIRKVGLRSTKILTSNNELIIFPNSKLADTMIQNITLPEPATRVSIPFSVAYGSNIEKVKRIVIKELESIKSLSRNKELIVRFLEMGDSGLKFRAYFYVDASDDATMNDSIDIVNTKIYNALNEHGISIPFPQMDVHLRRH